MTNYTYTVEDFKKASFARHETRGLATRDTGSVSLPWQDAGGDQWSDLQMLSLGWSPVREAAPLSLDTLRAAHEQAEVTAVDAPTRQGDVYISQVAPNDRSTGFYIAVAKSDGAHIGYHHRILSRAPQREAWADLADVLKAWDAGESALDVDVKSMARWLHERGVRAVTGGDDLGRR